MIFYGIQKLSLVDYDSEVSCTLFTRGCNMRCPFCHNYELVVYNENFTKAIPDEDIKNYLKSKVSVNDIILTLGAGNVTKLSDLLVNKNE